MGSTDPRRGRDFVPTDTIPRIPSRRASHQRSRANEHRRPERSPPSSWRTGASHRPPSSPGTRSRRRTCSIARPPTRRRSGWSRPRSCSTGPPSPRSRATAPTRPSSPGSPTARSTPASTASTGTWPSAVTRSPSTGRASRATARRSPTATCTSGVAAWPTACARAGSRRATASRSTWAWCPEIVVAMLACARIGAPHTVIFGGFSPESVRDRVLDCGCTAMITADGAWRGGKLIPLKANVDEALERCPDVATCVVVRRTENEIGWVEGRDVWYHELVAGAVGRERARADGRRGPALHPLHQRQHREAQGHPPHHGRVPDRGRGDAPLGVRHQGRRRLLVRGRRRLGDRAQLHRLRARSPTGRRACSTRARPTRPTRIAGGTSSSATA